ncbi:MAG: ATPase [Cytophagaceae bacterium]|nr:ATPase [Cytophagaceae bacterium]
MSKYKFTAEYELRASPKVLFPYVSTASGLSQWFASKVNTMPNHMYDFIWDGESHPARLSTLRQNKSVKFDFTPTDEERDHPYIEFRLDVSDLTQSTFLKVTDYSTNSEPDDLKAMWKGLLDNLREIVGS